MLNEQPEIFQITAESDPALWDTLHPSDDRRRTYNEDEIPGAEIQRIFGDLPEQITDEPLPTTLSAAEKAFANRLINIDRRFQYFQEQIDRQAFDQQFERSERQGEIDALSKHFSSEIAEIKAAQSVDGCEIASAQADVRSLQDRLEDFENTFEPAPSPAVQWVRAIAFLLTGAALALIAVTAIDYVNYVSLPAQPVPSVGSK